MTTQRFKTIIVKEGSRTTVTFAGIDFGGKRYTRVVPLLEKGHQLMKIRKLVFLQFPCGKVQLNRRLVDV